MYVMLMYSLFMFCSSMYLFILSWGFKILSVMLSLEWLIYSFKSTNMIFYILLDWVSLQFMSAVLLISSMVMLYSIVYMSDDLNLGRFYLLVFLFIVSMIMMILSPNLISILLGWDGLGLVSYCLVIYYNNYSSYNSGMVTVLSNRIGDVGILMAIGIMVSNGGWGLNMMDSSNLLVLILIVMAAMTKSAQIPFSYWLPQAMAAPTPVSSLVHSSTLVTAGVYLLIRFSGFLGMGGCNIYLFKLSLLTMFMAGLMANFEFDLKKIIALSTLSQLGLMMMALSVGFSYIAFFHLITHAIFKSLLFLCAGAMIHSMVNNQDIRYYGKMNEFIPFIMMSFYVSSLSLCGFPFMAGFYSKDLIMEIFYSDKFNTLMMLMSVLSLSFTVSYTVRLIYYLYFGPVNFYFSWHFNQGSWGMELPMFILLFMSVVIGSMMSWSMFFDFYDIYLDISLKLITVGACVLGGVIGVIMYLYSLMKFYFFSYFVSSMWMMSFLFSYIYKPFYLYWYVSNEIDKAWVEFSGKIFVIEIFENFKSGHQVGFYMMFMFCYLVVFLMVWLIVI